MPGQGKRQSNAGNGAAAAAAAAPAASADGGTAAAAAAAAAMEGSPSARKVYSWSEFEGMKTRAACSLDRVEFLAKSMDRFTEYKIDEAHRQELILRQRSTPSKYFQRSLDVSKTGAEKVFDTQRSLLTTHKTGTKRLEAMNRFFCDQEGRKGKQEFQAAKNSAKTAKPLVKEYPLYQELYDKPLRPDGQRRPTPGMAVMVPLPYEPPESALRHGMSQSLGSLSSNASPKAIGSKGLTA
mmetsp:Transcript_92329/g.202199  ORF Transcript_92329/g.202199 Transcript_92329/m.202199 type:complete len:239 (+) Transcript_92329:134-850(+)